MGQQAEEFFAAWVAAISRKSEEALHENQSSTLDARPRDTLEVEISAQWAMGVTRERERHVPGMEAAIARAASPGTQAEARADEIDHAAAMRAKAVRAAALRTDHLAGLPPRLARQDIQYQRPGQ